MVFILPPPWQTLKTPSALICWRAWIWLLDWCATVPHRCHLYTRWPAVMKPEGPASRILTSPFWKVANLRCNYSCRLVGYGLSSCSSVGWREGSSQSSAPNSSRYSTSVRFRAVCMPWEYNKRIRMLIGALRAESQINHLVAFNFEPYSPHRGAAGIPCPTERNVAENRIRTNTLIFSLQSAMVQLNLGIISH